MAQPAPSDGRTHPGHRPGSTAGAAPLQQPRRRRRPPKHRRLSTPSLTSPQPPAAPERSEIETPRAAAREVESLQKEMTTLRALTAGTSTSTQTTTDLRGEVASLHGALIALGGNVDI